MRSGKSRECYGIISDLQIPFEKAGALKFVKRVAREFRIPQENWLCVGDETDQYWGGLWKKSPDAKLTAGQELEACRQKLIPWYKAFPQMQLALSNHGTRYWRKALDAEIPNQLLRRYEEVIQAPPGWKWKKRILVKGSRKHFIVEHGDDWGGQLPHVKAAFHNGLSTVIGHHHSLSGIEHIKTNMLNIYGMVVGSLIDFDQFAFEYARRAARKPILTIAVILDGGALPILIPYSE